MTPLLLSHLDQQRLSEAMVALVSPLTYADVDAWRRTACQRVRELFGADKIIFILPGDGKSDLFTEGFDATIARYPDEIASPAREFGIFEKLRAHGVATRQMLYGDLRTFYRTRYWNDYARLHRAYASLTISVPVRSTYQLADHAQIVCNHDSPHKTPFEEREVAIGRLLLPALQAGALAWRRLAHARHAGAAMVDTLTGAALLYDSEGREWHRNETAERLFTTGSAAQNLRARAEQLARELGHAAKTTEKVFLRPVMAREGPFTLRATLLDEAVVITIDPSVAPVRQLPDAETLSQRFGLTRQQARVALQLASRRSTEEIAKSLFISPHTVRRHIEQVLERLGVARRGDVEQAVQQANR